MKVGHCKTAPSPGTAQQGSRPERHTRRISKGPIHHNGLIQHVSSEPPKYGSSEAQFCSEEPFGDRPSSRSTVRLLTRQAAGHAGEVFKEGGTAGSTANSPTIFKKLDENEVSNYTNFWSNPGDPLADFIPMYEGKSDGLLEPDLGDEPASAETQEGIGPCIRLQNVLFRFNQPFVMDCKMGTRSYEESECSSKKERKDLFDRLVKIGGSAFLTEEELQRGWITKHKWMSTRDRMSSSHDLGFRIDGIAGPGSFKVKADAFSQISKRASVVKLLQRFLQLPFLDQVHLEGIGSGSPEQVKPCDEKLPLASSDFKEDNNKNSKTIMSRMNLAKEFVDYLERFRESCESSQFFKSHEFIGSSLLFVADSVAQSGVHLIDLAKTRRVPDGVTIDHRTRWELGNHEDGFLFGIDSFVCCWQDVLDDLMQEFAALGSLKLDAGLRGLISPRDPFSESCSCSSDVFSTASIEDLPGHPASSHGGVVLTSPMGNTTVVTVPNRSAKVTPVTPVEEVPKDPAAFDSLVTSPAERSRVSACGWLMHRVRRCLGKLCVHM